MPRKYKNTSLTWRLFETSFILARGKDQQGNWLSIPCDSKGQAINMAQGMNACNMQYHRDQEIPLNFSDISARPLEVPVGSGNWVVQLGESYTHRARQNQRIETMLKQVLQSSGLQEQSTDAPKQAGEEIPQAITEAEAIQHQLDEDEKIKKLLGL